MEEAIKALGKEGFTKKQIKSIVGEKWNERAWRSMVRRSKKMLSSELPFYSTEHKKWFF